MNNTEFELLTKEQLLQMYEQVCKELDISENLIFERDSQIDELEFEVDYWRGMYEART